VLLFESYAFSYKPFIVKLVCTVGVALQYQQKKPLFVNQHRIIARQQRQDFQLEMTARLTYKYLYFFFTATAIGCTLTPL
jgi:hypothetical protein